MKTRESAEMYLETILLLSKKNTDVRSVDIVNSLDYSKPSVSVAMKNLREGGYILMDNNGFITLTAKGLEIAQSIYERHTLVANLFMSMGVDRETAMQDACKIEHVISGKSFLAIKKYMEKLQKN